MDKRVFQERLESVTEMGRIRRSDIPPPRVIETLRSRMGIWTEFPVCLATVQGRSDDPQAHRALRGMSMVGAPQHAQGRPKAALCVQPVAAFAYIALISASANSEHFTSVAPSMRRAKS
jgi:hypothetical protein